MSSQPSTPSNHDQEGRPTFWQRPFVLEVMPFLTSLMFHVGLLAIGILTYQAVTHLTTVTKEQTYVPVPGDIVVDGPPIVKGLGNSDGTTPDMPVLPADALLNSNAGGSGGPMVRTISLPGMEPNTQDSSTSISTGRRAIAGGVSGDGTDGAGGSGTGFGTGFGPGHGPGFFGIPGPKGPGANKICYVCDASGSMLNRFDELRGEIVKSVTALKTNRQFFNVIFFNDAKPTALSTGELLQASAFNKSRCEKFVAEATAASRTNPVPALDLAFKQHPQLIYLLTDGDFDDNEAVVAWIAEHNKDGKVKINTLHFVTDSSDPKEVLQAIATKNGGIFTVVKQP